MLKMFVEREARIVFVSTTHSYKLSHRQSGRKVAVHISAVLCSFTSPGMPDLNCCLFEQKNPFQKTGFSSQSFNATVLQEAPI